MPTFWEGLHCDCCPSYLSSTREEATCHMMRLFAECLNIGGWEGEKVQDLGVFKTDSRILFPPKNQPSEIVDCSKFQINAALCLINHIPHFILWVLKWPLRAQSLIKVQHLVESDRKQIWSMIGSRSEMPLRRGTDLYHLYTNL